MCGTQKLSGYQPSPSQFHVISCTKDAEKAPQTTRPVPSPGVYVRVRVRVRLTVTEAQGAHERYQGIRYPNT